MPRLRGSSASAAEAAPSKHSISFLSTAMFERVPDQYVVERRSPGIDDQVMTSHACICVKVGCSPEHPQIESLQQGRDQVYASSLVQIDGRGGVGNP